MLALHNKVGFMQHAVKPNTALLSNVLEALGLVAWRLLLRLNVEGMIPMTDCKAAAALAASCCSAC